MEQRMRVGDSIWLVGLGLVLPLGCSSGPENSKAATEKPASPQYSGAVESLEGRGGPSEQAATQSTREVSRPQFQTGEELIRYAVHRTGLHEFYLQAYVFGGMTDDCSMLLHFPMEEYDLLSQGERQLLVDYLERCIRDARQDPWRYLHDLPRTAPAAPRIERNVRRIRDGAWAIRVGRVRGVDVDESSDGNSRLVKPGDPSLSAKPMSRRASPASSDGSLQANGAVWERIFARRYGRSPSDAERAAFASAPGGEAEKFQAVMKVAEQTSPKSEPTHPTEAPKPSDFPELPPPPAKSASDAEIARVISQLTGRPDPEVIEVADNTVEELRAYSVSRTRRRLLSEMEEMIRAMIQGMRDYETRTGKKHPDSSKNLVKEMARQFIELAKVSRGE